MEQNKPDIYIYHDPHPTLDWLVLQWYLIMQQEGSLESTFAEKQHTPGNFLRYFNTDAHLMFNVDGNGIIDKAAWLEPFMHNASFLGLYIGKDARRSRASLDFVKIVYEMAFEKNAVLVGIVNTERKDYDKIIKEHRKLGYSEPTTIPYIFGGQGGSILYITKEAWDEHWGRKGWGSQQNPRKD